MVQKRLLIKRNVFVWSEQTMTTSMIILMRPPPPPPPPLPPQPQPKRRNGFTGKSRVLHLRVRFSQHQIQSTFQLFSAVSRTWTTTLLCFQWYCQSSVFIYCYCFGREEKIERMLQRFVYISSLYY